MSKMLSWTFFASGNFLMIFGSWTRMFSTLSQLSSAVQWMMQNTFVSCAMNFHETTLDEAWNLQKFSQTTGGGGAAVTTDWGFSAKVIFRWSVKKWSPIVFQRTIWPIISLGIFSHCTCNSVRKGYQHDVMIVVAQYALPELDQLTATAPEDGDWRFTGQPKLCQVMTTVYFCSTLNPFEKHAKMTSIDVDLNHGSDIKDIWDVFSHSSSLCQGSSQPSYNVT